MAPFLVYYDDCVLSGVRLKAEETGHTLAYHFRQAIQLYLSGSYPVGTPLSGCGLCSGSVLTFQGR